MSGRAFVLLLVLAAIITGTTYLFSTETQETLSDPGLADLDRRAKVHGWPWGYFAEVTELTRVSANQVAVLEYTDLRWPMLAQTYVFWFVASLLLAVILLLVLSPSQKRVLD